MLAIRGGWPIGESHDRIRRCHGFKGHHHQRTGMLQSVQLLECHARSHPKVTSKKMNRLFGPLEKSIDSGDHRFDPNALTTSVCLSSKDAQRSRPSLTAFKCCSKVFERSSPFSTTFLLLITFQSGHLNHFAADAVAAFQERERERESERIVTICRLKFSLLNYLVRKTIDDDDRISLSLSLALMGQPSKAISGPTPSAST